MRVARVVMLLTVAAAVQRPGGPGRSVELRPKLLLLPHPWKRRTRWDPNTGRSGGRVRRPRTATARRRQAEAGTTRQLPSLGQRRRDVGDPLSGRDPSAAQVYLVPAEHYLAFRLAPDRCLPVAERSFSRSTAFRLRLQREYSHHALCLLTLSTPGAARRPVAPRRPAWILFLFGPGNPGFGLAPNGVSQVEVHYISDPSLSIAVHRNFWAVNVVWSSGATPCGLDWLDGAIVLRIVKSCRKIDTD